MKSNSLNTGTSSNVAASDTNDNSPTMSSGETATSGQSIMTVGDRFAKIVEALGSRAIPFRSENLFNPRFAEMLKTARSKSLPSAALSRFVTNYPQWSFGIPVGPGLPFFGIEVNSIYAQDEIDELGGFPPTPCLETTRGVTYLFERPPYPLNRTGSVPDDMKVLDDSCYIIIPGIDRLRSHNDWIACPTQIEFARLPEWARSWVLPIKWNSIATNKKHLDQFLAKLYEPALYDVTVQTEMYQQYKKAAVQHGVPEPTFDEFDRSLITRGIVPYINHQRLLRGIRRIGNKSSQTLS